MRAHRPDERGQSLVEFALTIPIVMLLMVGLFDLGRVVFINNGLSDGARHGARHATTDPRDADYCSRIDDAVQSAIRGQPLAEYLVTYTIIDPDGVVGASYELCADGADGSDFGSLPNDTDPGDRVTVRLEADVDLITPFVAAATGRGTFNLEAESTMVVTFAPTLPSP